LRPPPSGAGGAAARVDAGLPPESMRADSAARDTSRPSDGEVAHPDRDTDP
jgi:hypothetical protein